MTRRASESPHPTTWWRCARRRSWRSGPAARPRPQVAADQRFRVALRVYMVNGMRDTGSVSMPFRVRIFPGATETPVVEDVVAVATPYATDLKFPPEPLYPAIYQNHDLVLSYPILGSYDRVRVEVEPVGLLPGGRVPLFWAFASVAHKETQHVTVISPQ